MRPVLIFVFSFIFLAPLFRDFRTSNFSATADRWSVLLDLFERELSFQQSKKALLEVYYEAYTHTIDPEKMRALAQRMVDLLAHRPRFDLDRSVSSYAPVYQSESALLREQASLYREVMYAQLEEEVIHAAVPTPLAGGAGSAGGAGGGGGGGGSSAAAPGATASAHAAFDWTLFSTEYSSTASDPQNLLSSLQIRPCGALSHPLTHPHSLLQFRASFDVLLDVADEFDRAVARIEAALPLPTKKVRSSYLIRIRQSLVEESVHYASATSPGIDLLMAGERV